MKIAGKKLEGPNQEVIIIPRGDSPDEAIVFKARAVLDTEEFDALCPRPRPPVKILRGGRRVTDTDQPEFQQQLESYATKRIAWLVLKSLEATESLEWETVDLGNPATWIKFEDELKASGFSVPEVHRIITGCLSVNGLDDEKLNRAREDFLASQALAEAEASSSRKDGQNSTPSGEAANDSI